MGKNYFCIFIYKNKYMIQLKQLHSETGDDLQLCGVYTIANLITNKIYVGSTSVSFYERWRAHLKDLKRNKHHSKKLQNSVNKYGLINFKFEILEITNPEFSSSTEKYWFDLLNPIKFGYNVSYSTTGGCLGYKLKKEHKLILSKINKGNKRRKGVLHSDETKKQIKESVKKFYEKNTERVNEIKLQRKKMRIKLNKTILKELNKKPIIQIDLYTNEIIRQFPSAKDAATYLNKPATSITRVCKGKSKYAYGFKWEYLK